MKALKLKRMLLFMVLYYCATSFAEAPPVVNLYDDVDNDSFTNEVTEVTENRPSYQHFVHSNNNNYEENRDLNMGLKLQSVQDEIRKLRGMVEMQGHQIQVMRKEEQKILIDFNRRLSKLESEQRVSSGLSSNHMNESDNSADRKIQLLGAVNQLKSADMHESLRTTESFDKVIQEQKDYHQAYRLIQSKRYTQASSAMADYLLKHPNGQFAANAHYWLGELYLLSGNGNAAQKEFSTVITHYPNNPKVADAILKIGFIYYDQGQWQKAKDHMVMVVHRFPGTSAAQLANARLRELEQQHDNS